MEEQVRFSVGDLTLEGLLAVSARTPRVGVVVCHPHPLFGGEMRNNVVTALVDAFGRAGFATLRFNFRGVGTSGGTHDEGRAEVDDVKGAVTFLASRVSAPSIAVAGYSFGSIVGMRAGADDPRVHKLIGVALPIARRDASFLSAVSKPKLLISGDRDDISPLPQLNDLFSKLPEPKSLAIVRGADHFFAGLEEGVAMPATAFLAP